MRLKGQRAVDLVPKVPHLGFRAQDHPALYHYGGSRNLSAADRPLLPIQFPYPGILVEIRRLPSDLLSRPRGDYNWRIVSPWQGDSMTAHPYDAEERAEMLETTLRTKCEFFGSRAQVAGTPDKVVEYAELSAREGSVASLRHRRVDLRGLTFGPARVRAPDVTQPWYMESRRHARAAIAASTAVGDRGAMLRELCRLSGGYLDLGVDPGVLAEPDRAQLGQFLDLSSSRHHAAKR